MEGFIGVKLLCLHFFLAIICERAKESLKCSDQQGVAATRSHWVVVYEGSHFLDRNSICFELLFHYHWLSNNK